MKEKFENTNERIGAQLYGWTRERYSPSYPPTVLLDAKRKQIVAADFTDWSGDINSALNLPIPQSYWWELTRYCYDANYAVLHVNQREFQGEFDGGAEALAEAICLAWLAYREAEGTK